MFNNDAIVTHAALSMIPKEMGRGMNDKLIEKGYRYPIKYKES